MIKPYAGDLSGNVTTYQFQKKTVMRAKAFTLLLILAVASSLAADENDWFYPLGLPPKASPRRIQGGESIVPLPLPGSPLRRSERKRQPSPQMLFGKVMWGETAAFTYPGGIASTISDWNLCPADLQQLLAKANRVAGLVYGSEPIELSTFSGDPTKTPVLLFSGTRSLKLSQRQLDLLRAYVLNRAGLSRLSPADASSRSSFLSHAFRRYQSQSHEPFYRRHRFPRPGAGPGCAAHGSAVCRLSDRGPGFPLRTGMRVGRSRGAGPQGSGLL